MAHFEKLPMYADTAPLWVLFHHPQDQGDDFIREGRPPWPTKLPERRPFSPHEFAMPPEHGFGLHEHAG
ncbi:MAG TPA: hypothetical protein VIO85_09235 [Candidatus Dormibacteraeota bacterium]|jgi:hypothetical protein